MIGENGDYDVPRKTKDIHPSNEPPDFHALLKRAETGDEAALKAMRPLIKTPDFWRQAADLVFNAESTVVNRLAGKNLVVRESVQAQLTYMKNELGGPSPSPLEKLLVDRIALLWVQLTYYETIYTQQMSDLSIRQSESQQRRIDATHRRYLAAIRTLAQVRRLAVPVVQVNVAQPGAKQLNVAAPASLSTSASTEDENTPFTRLSQEQGNKA